MKRYALLYLPLLLCVAGCAGKEVAETSRNLGDAVCDAVTQIAKDPATALSPAGAITCAALVAVGFFSKQSASVAKWAGKKTSGPLMRALKKVNPNKKD